MTLLERLTAKEREAILESQSTFPIKLGVLSHQLGVNVFRATLPAGISGEIKKTDEGRYIIRVNRHESKNRQRFTLAHELGHYLLHRDQIGDGIADDALYRSRLSNALEYEANKFAADLLMPSAEVHKLLERYKHIDNIIDYVSKYFGVSNQAAEIRLGI